MRAEERRRQGGEQGERGVWDGITGGCEGRRGEEGRQVSDFKAKEKKKERRRRREMEGRKSGAGGDSCSASSSLHATSPELTSDLLLTRTATRVHCASKSRCLLTRPKPKAFHLFTIVKCHHLVICLEEIYYYYSLIMSFFFIFNYSLKYEETTSGHALFLF